MSKRAYLLAKELNVVPKKFYGIMQQMNINKNILSVLTTAEEKALNDYYKNGRFCAFEKKDPDKEDTGVDWDTLGKAAYIGLKIFGG